jgi:hypothetical protein
MQTHSFLFHPGIWLGQGSIEMSFSAEILEYYTRWKISEMISGLIFCSQEVELHGVAEKKINHYVFSEITQKSFIVELENADIGKIFGKGIIKDQVIAWEFQGLEEACEGFEIFQKQADDRYSTRAEFGTDDQTSTLIKGSIWKQAPET